MFRPIASPYKVTRHTDRRFFIALGLSKGYDVMTQYWFEKMIIFKFVAIYLRVYAFNIPM